MSGVWNEVLCLTTGAFAAGAVAWWWRRRAARSGDVELQAIYDNAAVGIAKLGVDGTWLRANQRLCDMLGYGRAELKRLTFQQISHPGELEKNLALYRRALAGEIDRYGLEKRYFRKDAEIVWANLTVALVRDRAGRPLFFVSVIEDITERRRADAERLQLEERMRHGQKLEKLGILAGGIAHDFNNLLMGVLGNADLALQRAAGDADHRTYLERIGQAARRAGELANQMLAYSGKGRFHVEPVNMSVLVHDMTRLMNVTIPRQATLELDLAEDLPFVEADATQLRQVVLNLLTNAAEAIGGEGVIRLETAALDCDATYLARTDGKESCPPGRYVRLRVTDTGAGMDPETARRIFDPFFTTKFTGRGLGMAVVLGIVRGHGGAIRVDSQSGRGTTVEVVLPVRTVAPRAPNTPAPRAAEAPPGRGTVLVVDDDETVRDVCASYLRDHGYAVLLADDGRHALEEYDARSAEVTAVLLDIAMPRLGGEETYRELRARRPDLPVVLASGYDQRVVTDPIGGPTAFIQKPFSARDLLAKLGEVM